jgi:hypothetical protein
MQSCSSLWLEKSLPSSLAVVIRWDEKAGLSLSCGPVSLGDCSRITGKPESAGINRHVGVSSGKLVHSVRIISPG